MAIEHTPRLGLTQWTDPNLLDPVHPDQFNADAAALEAYAANIEATTPTVFNVKGYGAVGDGATDDTAAITAAVQAASSAGGGTVFVPPGSYAFSDVITIPTRVDLRGAGGGPQGSHVSRFLATAPAAQLAFGTRGSGNTGGTSGGFSVDGNNIAIQPFYMGRVVGRTFTNIIVTGAAGDGWLFEAGQNNTFIGCEVHRSAGSGMVLDVGCGGNLFLRTELNANGTYGLVIRETAGTGPYNHPQHNRFVHSLFERPSYTTGTASGLVKVTGGTGNMIDSSIIAGGHDGAFSEPLVQIVPDPANPSSSRGLILQNSTVSGDSSDRGIYVQGGLRLVGRNTLLALGTGIELYPGAYGSAENIIWNGVTTKWAGSINHYGVLTDERTRQIGVSLEDTNPSNYFLFGRVAGEAGLRVGLRSDGNMVFMDGTSYTPDTLLLRVGPNVLGMGYGDSFRVDGAWNGGTLRVGPWYLWDDGTNLRAKRGVPTSATDGIVVA